MEEQCSPLGWAYYYQEDQGTVDVLKQSLLYTTLELEAAVISAHDEISRKDDEILQLKTLLSKVIKERDEFQVNSRELALQKQLLFQQLQIMANSSDPCPTTNDHDDPDRDTLPDVISLKRPLPEQGKFHQAVMEAGPLLQTLLLAGPLPQWQHPPPQLNSVDIPPATMISPADSCLISPTTNKRSVVNWDGPDFSPSSKYQKVCSPIDHPR